MSWIDRLRPAAYTSAGGQRLTFDYADVQRTVDKQTSGFQFPDADGTYVQDLGHSGRRYPLRVFFSGADCDLEAAAFESALLVRGVGRLEHPMYGTVDVVPYGTIARRDDLVTAANQAVIDVTFWETIGLIYPTPQSDPASAVLSAVQEYNVAASSAFERATNLVSAIEQVALKNNYLVRVGEVSSAFATLLSAGSTFDTIVRSLTLGLDVLVSQPGTLAAQTAIMIQSPASAPTSISERLVAYAGLISSITSTSPAIPGNDARGANEFFVNDLFASTYVTASVASAVNTQFLTKTEALTTAEEILSQLDQLTAWREDNFESLQEVDDGESYQKLQRAVALTAGFLVEISFSLKQERSLVLGRSRTIIDLAAELYGSVDDQLDFLIDTNNLSGSEILEIPKGRTVVYYR